MALTDRLDPRYVELLRTGVLKSEDTTQYPTEDMGHEPIDQSVYHNSETRDTDAIKNYFDKQKAEDVSNASQSASNIGLPDINQLTSPFPNSPQTPTILGNPNYQSDYSKFQRDVGEQQKSSNKFIGGLTSPLDRTTLDSPDSIPFMLQNQGVQQTRPVLSKPDKNDTTNFVAGPEESESEEVYPQIDPNDSILNKTPKHFSEGKSAKELLDLSKAPGVSPSIDVTPPQIQQPEDDYNDRLSRAEDTDSKNNLLFGLLKAAQMGGSALAGTKADTSFADEQLKNPDKAVGHLESRSKLMDANTKRLEEAKLSDPNSDISKQGMAMLASVYPDIAAKYPNLSANQLKSMGMNLGQLATTKEQTESRKEIAKENAEARKETARMHSETLGVARENKLNEQEAKRLESYRKERDPMLASIRSNLGKEVNRYTQSTHAIGLVHGIKDLDQVTPMQKRELAVALATMVSPGLPHEATIAKLDESTLNDEIAHRLQQLTGKPMSTNTKGLTKQLVDSVNNQRKIASKYISDYQAGVDASYSKDMLRNPSAFQNISKFQTFNVDSDQPQSSNSTTISNKTSVPLTSPLPAGRTFTHDNKNYKVNPDGKSATEI